MYFLLHFSIWLFAFCLGFIFKDILINSLRISYIVFWVFSSHSSISSQTHPSFHIHPTLCAHFVLTHGAQLVLPLYSQLCGHALDLVLPTRGHTLKTLTHQRLFQQLSVTNSSSAKDGTSCALPVSMLRFCSPGAGCRYCAKCYTFCEVACLTALMCRGDTISFSLLLTLTVFPCPLPQWSLSL